MLFRCLCCSGVKTKPPNHRTEVGLNGPRVVLGVVLGEVDGNLVVSSVVVVVVVVLVVSSVVVVFVVIIVVVEGKVGAPLQDEISGVLGPLIVSHSGAKVSRNLQTLSSSV